MSHHRNSRPMPRFCRLLRWALIAFAAAVLLGGLALATLYFVVSAKLPDVQTLRHVEMQEPMYVYAREGRLLALFGETRRYPIDIEEVPKRLKQAFLATAAARFYEHHGVDYTGVARATWLIHQTGTKEGRPGGPPLTHKGARPDRKG